MSLNIYWFTGAKLRWVNIRKKFFLIACESFSYLNCPYAKIRNIVEWDALIRFTDLARLAVWANSKGGNIFVFTLCGQAIFLNLRWGWIRIWLWPNLVNASPQKALMLPWAMANLPQNVWLKAFSVSGIQREVDAVLLWKMQQVLQCAHSV